MKSLASHKICCSCGILKPRTDYYFRPNKKWILAYCKECCNNKNKTPEAMKRRNINYKRWYDNHSVEKIKQSCNYIKTNQKRHQVYGANRRAAKNVTSDKSVTYRSIKGLLCQQDNKCIYCEKDISISFHIDHKTPLMRGGAHKINNIQLLCAYCNLSKNKKTHEEFLKEGLLCLKIGKQHYWVL
jgi:hypothetical protein